jgi:DNA-binding beta-propeller fold protein YncE
MTETPDLPTGDDAVEPTDVAEGAVATEVAAAAEVAPALSQEELDRKRRRRIIALVVLAILLLLVAAIFAWYLITRKPLSALPGIVSEQTPSYGYSVYHVSAPIGVAVSPDGSRIYVTQQGSNMPVVVLTRDGEKLGTLQPPRFNTKARTPQYVAVNPVTNDVWVTDRVAKAIYVFDQSGAPAIKDTWQPLAIAFDKDGNMYISDVRDKAQRIIEFDSNGAQVRTLTVTDRTMTPLSYPNGIAVDENGVVFVADSNNARILAFDSNGAATIVAAAGMADGDVGMPRGLAFDDSGRLLTVDTVNHVAISYRPADPPTSVTAVGTWGTEGIGDGQFEYPNGITTDTRGKVYVTDRVNNRVQVWSY